LRNSWEWQTLLPINTPGKELGQRKYDPSRPAGDPGNHYVSWDELMNLMQTDLPRAQEIMKWGGHPNSDDYNDNRPIPWLSSTIEGIVTNSCLAGRDVAFTHRERVGGYWLGKIEPPYHEDCGTFEANNAFCNDWEVFVKPYSPYGFLLARDETEEISSIDITTKPPTIIHHKIKQGNFNEEYNGTLEGELEQWLVPVGYRPEPGDHILMTGRWIIDCGHDDWHTELHPYELIVSSHTEASNKQEAINKVEVAASVVVTGAWAGGTLEFDIWPPARPLPNTILHWEREQDPNVVQELTVEEKLQPENNPNHIHVKVTSTAPWSPMPMGNSNDIYYNTTRRLATTYRLWWCETVKIVPSMPSWLSVLLLEPTEAERNTQSWLPVLLLDNGMPA
jgi:hypothetical protein